MSTYIYTHNNNAIRLGEGPGGPKGATGLTGTRGADGPQGDQGAKGPGNLGKTDVSFSCDTSASFFEVAAGQIVLVGHTTTNSLNNLSSVKVIVGADTGNTICQAGLVLMNHTTENPLANNSTIIASSKFEIKGFGKTKDFRIVNLDIDPNLWPINDDIVGLWAYIDYPKEKEKSYLAEVERLYDAKEAVIAKETIKEKTELTRSKFYSSLTKDYGIAGSGIITEERNILTEKRQVLATKARINQEEKQAKENKDSLKENRRTKDYKEIGSDKAISAWVGSNITLEVAYLQFS